MQTLYKAVLILSIAMVISDPGIRAQDSVIIDPTRVPSDSLACISVWPKKISEMKVFRLYPLEIAAAYMEQEWGINLFEVERLDVVIGSKFDAQKEPFGVLITLTNPVPLDSLKSPLIDTSKVESDNGFEYAKVLDTRLILHSINNRQYLLGGLPFVKKMAVTNNPPSVLSKLVGSVKTPANILALVNVLEIRDQIVQEFSKSASQSFEREIPKEILSDLKQISSSIDQLLFIWSESPARVLKLIVVSENEKMAVDTRQSITRLLAYWTAQISKEMDKVNNRDLSPAIDTALKSYVRRINLKGVDYLTPLQKGNRLIYEAPLDGVSMPNSVAGVGMMAGLLLPAIQQSREAARRMSCSSNVRQIVIAFLNYEFANKKLPAAAIVDKSTQKPLLSWRVAILPFIEEQALYAEFHLDEPWDSPHNIKLLDRIPGIYRCPSTNLKAGYTTYVVPSSEECGLHPTKQLGLRDFKKGMSNTVIVLEASPDRAVPWTAPQDFEPDKERLMDMFKPTVHREGFHATMLDGSVRYFPLMLEQEAFWNMLKRR